MAWLESHQALGQHPKTKRLARLLNVSRVTAVGHLHMLWWWALDYAQDGSLAKYHADEISDAAEWEGEPDLFLDALIQSGFVDAETLDLHDWLDYAGKLIGQKQKNAERMREARAKRNIERATHVQRTQTERAMHVQGLPNQPTVPNQQKDHSSSSLEILDTPAHEQTPPPLPQDDLSDADPYAVIDQRMSENLGKRFAAKDDDYRLIKTFVASAIPLSFIVGCMDRKFKEGKKPRSFTYFTDIVPEEWAKELAKREPTKAIEMSVYATASQRAGPAISTQIDPDELIMKEMLERAHRSRFGSGGTVHSRDDPVPPDTP